MSMARVSTLVSMVTMVAFSVLRRLLGLIGMASLARLLAPSDLGAYAFTQSTGQTFVGLFRFGALQGLQVSLARRMSVTETEDAGTLIGGGILLVCGMAAVGGAVMVPLAGPIARDLFGAPELTPYVTAAAVFFVGQFLSKAAFVGFAGLGRFVEYTYWATAIGFATVGATILGALVFGVQGAVWGFVGTTLAGVPVFVLSLLRMLRGTGIRVRLRLTRAHVREVFSIGLPFYGAGLFMIPAGFVAQGAVSRFGGVSDLADLRIVLTLMGVVELVPQAIAGPIISLFSEREGRAAGSGMASAFVHMRWLWIFALVTGATLAAIWPLAVLMVFGEDYSQAAQLGQLGIAGFLPVVVGTALMAGVLVGRRTLPLLFIGALQAGVMLGLAFLLIPSIGLPGLFAAQATAGIAAVVLRLAVLGRQTGTALWRSWMAPLLVATVALYAVLIVDVQLAETALQRAMAATMALPALCLWIAFAVLSGQERAAVLDRFRQEAGRLRARLAARRGAGPI